MKTRWKPVDLVCREDDEEFTVRTKLARDAESTGVCIAEAVSHALLLASGFAAGFSEAATLEADVSKFSRACHDEWFDGAGVDPSLLEGFLVHRIRKLAVLARKDHWRRVASLNPGGEYAFDLS